MGNDDALACALEDAATWKSMALQLKDVVAQQTEIISLLKEHRAAAHRAPDPVNTVALPSISIREIFAKYKAARCHEHSWGTIEDKLSHLVRRLGDLPAAQLDHKKWEEHRIARRAEKMDYGRSRGRGPAESSLNIELGVAKTMLEWAETQGHLIFNPLRKARKAKTKGPRKTWLKEYQLQQFLAFTKPDGREQSQMLRAFILVDFDSGARFNEIRLLRRDRLRQRVESDGLEEAMGWVVDIDATKNSKAHVIGLTQRAHEALLAIGEIDGSPYFFARKETKRPYTRKQISRWFRQACDSTGIDSAVATGEIRLTPHDGRRSAATNAHNRGGSLLEVQNMLNHSSPATTAQYVQINEANAVKMARIMDAGIEREARRRPPKRAEHVAQEPTGDSISDVRGGR